ncbi:hypothetical protein JOQ06_028127, partial [Pogonophryne albipinna]
MHTIHRLCRGCIAQNLPQVSVSRGDDGFGFTICCDAPVRVQAVEPGGPAQAAGLRQGDSVLQLDSLPVETWQCVDLAHAIRSCSSQILLVVWRGLPELRPHSQTTGRKLLPHPAHSKHGCRRAVDPGGQLLQSVYQDGEGAIGRLYQTHPSRGQHLLPDPRPFTCTLPPPTSTSSNHPGNYGNYQNCTIVQSHVPCSYGPYSSPAPKTLIFPVFVQPLDLCSPDRTLLMSEEMILHQDNQLPARVTVLIYSDLLLFTREDEAGRCNVLQSPVYLNTLQLREVSSAPLQIHFLSGSLWVFSLEAFSFDQQLRVSLCLHDNIQLQLVASEAGHTHQLPDLPSDFGLLSLGRPSPPLSPLCDSLRASSPYFPTSHLPSLPTYPSSSSPCRIFPSLLPRPPSSIRIPESDEEEELSFTPAVLRRSLSEGSLLLEPRSPCFLKQLTREGASLHQMLLLLNGTKVKTSTDPQRPVQTSTDPQRPVQTRRDQYRPVQTSTDPQRPVQTSTDPQRPVQTRRDQYRPVQTRRDQYRPVQTRRDQYRPVQTRRDQYRPVQTRRDQAADVRSHLLFLRRRKNSTCFHGNSLEKALRNNRSPTREVLRWAESLEALLTNQYGLAVFRHFLRSEFSEENLDFWLAVERFKRTCPLSKMAARAGKIYQEFVSTAAARQ